MSEPPATSLVWRARFGVTLTLGMAFGTFPQYALSVLAPLIIDDLRISRALLGGLTATFFAMGALLSPLAGRVVDRLGGYRVLVALYPLAAGGFAAMASAPSLAWLWVAVAFAGMAGATVNPVTNHLIAARIEPGRQGVLTGIKQSGVQLGAFVAGVALPPLALAIGWRGALGVCSAAALAALCTAPVARTRRGEPRPDNDPGGRVPVPSFVWWLACYALLMGAGVSAFTAYLPLYGVEQLNLSVTVAGLAAGVVGGVGVVARVLWARRVERLAAPQATLALLALVAALSQALLWSAAALGTWLLWVAAVGLGSSAIAWNAVAMLTVVRQIPSQSTGRASGIVLSGFYIGLMVAPMAVGASIDRTGSYGPAWATVTTIFGLAALLAWGWSRRS